MSIKQCNCKHPYQDEQYGKGNRVHNEVRKARGNGKGSIEIEHRCTVCGAKR